MRVDRVSDPEAIHNVANYGGYASKGDAQKRLEWARGELATWEDTLRDRERLAGEIGSARAALYVEIAQKRVDNARGIVALYERAVRL